MLFDENVNFYGTYRPYQQRVLDNLTSFLANEKIHVVAAPGSGKTTLGLELIKRLNKPSLILVPSIAIREQWIDRFCAGFLSDLSLKDKWISNDIKIQRPIICITYQAFYSAYKKEINNESIDDESVEESDFNSFDLIETLNSYKIETICLDECHHLKSEWWKALENVIKKIKDCKLIALTATPPYDSSSVEWQRYIDLCGPIDEEIFVPELIKDNNICPHQDYIYFSYPTEDEEKAILKSYSNGLKIFSKYKNNDRLVEIIKKNTIYLDFDLFKKAFYENEDYYRALVLFLHENNVKVPFLVRLLVRIEPFVISHMEVLLQHVLFEDQQSYEKDDMMLSLKKELSALGVVHNRKVCIVHDDRIDKKMSMSLSKLESIKNIVKHEYSCIKEQMKCLVLADYIKQKTKNYIGNLEKEIDSFGTIPIFEYLRRSELNDVKLCCISGSICIIHESCKDYLSEEFSYEKLENTDYLEIFVNTSNKKKLVLEITSLFEKGLFNVLIGTKSLLGEGWDSPCINTLILASFVGSSVLSNQTRGRAIRTNKNDVNKISNVWHLVCLNPFDYNYSFDFYNLEKRCSSFIGIDVENQKIENGIERLAYKKVPKNAYEMEIANNKMVESSRDRENVKKTWDDCINRAKKIEDLSKLTIIPIRRIRREYSFFNTLTLIVLGLLALLSNYGLFTYLVKTGIGETASKIISVSLFFAFLINILYLFYRLITLFTPKRKLITIARSLLKALIKKGSITSKKCKVKVKYRNITTLSVRITNATTYEQNIFSESIKELLGEINQPRYLLIKPSNIMFKESYVVPNAFKKNKELVKILEKEMSKRMGKFGIVFAKNESGKDIVLKAQIQHYIKFKKVNIETKNELLLTKKGKNI